MKQLTVIFISILLFSACKETKESREALLPESAGQLAEIVVITDKASLDSSYKVAIETVFAEELNGLPSPAEPHFKILYTDETFFKGYFQSHQNIFVLVTNDNVEKLKKIIGEANIKKVREVLNGPIEVLGFNRNNVWAQNQNVFYVTGKTQEDILAKLKNRKNDLLSLAHANEVKMAETKFFITSAKADSFRANSLAQKGYAVRKPKSYRVAIDKLDFTWLRKSPSDKEQDFGILLFDVPYTSKSQLTTQSLIDIRNTFTKQYVPGTIEG